MLTPFVLSWPALSMKAHLTTGKMIDSWWQHSRPTSIFDQLNTHCWATLSYISQSVWQLKKLKQSKSWTGFIVWSPSWPSYTWWWLRSPFCPDKWRLVFVCRSFGQSSASCGWWVRRVASIHGKAKFKLLWTIRWRWAFEEEEGEEEHLKRKQNEYDML